MKGICMQAFNNEEINVLPKRFQIAFDKLSRSENLKIQKADKGGAVVVMNVNEYKNKALNLLNDPDTYEELSNPPTIAEIQKKFSTDVKTILRNIEEGETKDIILSKVKTRLPNFSYFYGSPKIHKENVPLRPIIATCGSPQSDLAKWLATKLSPLLGKISNAHLLHSYEFIERLRELGPTSGRMMSLDVTSLFTNVPLDFVLNNLKEASDSGIFTPPIPIDLFCDLIRLCVDATIFTFDDKIYKQKFGVAMGSPLSPILANLCLEFIEKNHIQSLPDNIKPLFYVRYVDDIFIIYKHDDHSFNTFLDTINSIIPSIKFTVEYENNNTLPFLDVQVKHNIDYTFSYSVYRKATNTESYIHFFSFHSQQVKSLVLCNMFTRAFRICDPQNLDKEIQHIREAFKNLAYPENFINQCLSKSRRKWYNPTPKTNEKTKHLTLPYHPKLVPLQQEYNKFNKNETKSRVAISFKYKNTIRSRLVRNRKVKSNSGVYCIPCKDCNKSYFGESGRGLDTRIEEHKQSVRKGYQYSAIATHCLDVEHRVNFNEARMVYRSNNVRIRRLVEGALIDLKDTFENNKSFTQENSIINYMICKILKIDQDINNPATLRIAAPPLFSQVTEGTLNRGNSGTGTYAADQRIPPDDEPPDDRDNDLRPLRRSQRIIARNQR